MSPERAESPSVSMTLPAACTLALVCFLAALGAVPLPPSSRQLVTDLLQVVLCIAAGIACGTAASRARELPRAFWCLVTVFVATWTVGQLLWIVEIQTLSPANVSWRSDLFFIASSAPLLLGLVVRPDRPRRGTLGFLFDLSLVVVFALHAYLYFSLGYFVDGRDVRYGEWVNALGNLDSILLLVGIFWAYRGAKGPWRRTYGGLALVIVMLNGGSALSSYAVLADAYRPGLYDLPWTAPFLWLAFVGLRWRPALGSAPQQRPPDYRETRSGLVLAISMVVAVPVTHLLMELTTAPTQGLSTLRHLLTIVSTGLLGALFLARQLALLQRTERVHLEHEAYLKRLFDSHPLPQFLCRRDTLAILDANLAAEQTYGFGRDELLGRTLSDLHPLEVSTLGAAIDKATSSRDDGRLEGDWHGRTRAGTMRTVELTARALEVGAQRAVLVVASDVTLDRDLEDRLRHSQKMEALGRLAGGVAHDFNNLLTAILGYCSLLGLQLKKSSTKGFLREIERAGERAAALTKQLLAFSRKQVLVPQVVDLGAVVRDMATMLRPLVGADIELVVLAPENAMVKADPGQVEQVVLNLAVNARDAMPEGGKLAIEVGTGGEDDGVVLTVSDTGAGMDGATVSRVFEPFFTTKPVGRGTGLGLATVYGIVTQSGGTVGIDTELGSGTRVSVRLPRVDGPVAERAARPEENAPLSRSATVLLVEDEDVVRSLASQILVEQGYRVLAAEDACQALQMVSSREGELDLVVTDVVMPGMKGPELVATLHERHPDLRVLYVSGYAADSLGLGGLLDPETSFLPKPFNAAMLASRVRELLNRVPREA